MLDLDTAFTWFPMLETERLSLRPMAEADADAIWRLRSDAKAMRYFGIAPMADPAEAHTLIAQNREQFQERKAIRWAIVPRGGGTMIGSCAFWKMSVFNERAEIGYELAPEYWGRGLMPEAVRAMLDFGFDVLKLHSVEAQIHPDNNGSRRVLEKLGFVQEGYFRENYADAIEGGFTDTAVFSLLDRDWQAGRKP